jgi:3-deoxy-7-phosphoheptulonate synthase
MLTDLLKPTLSSPERRRVTIGDVVFGGPAVPVIAGPCAVEPEYVRHALAMRDAGAAMLRASIFKPRTRPDAFQGMGEAGLELVEAARAATGRPILVEPLSVEHVELLGPRVDAFMIGARSMQNTPLLRAAGGSGLPVVLKRGMAATYDEWLAAADYVLGEGNQQVILCERGIRTFETATRNTLDVSAVPVLRERTPLPVIVDPSHAAGRADWVPSLALAAVAAGADGRLIESHPVPAESWSDAAQAITPLTLEAIIAGAAVLAPMLRAHRATELAEHRRIIDSLDQALGAVLQSRAGAVDAVQRDKRRQGLPVRDRAREQEVIARVADRVPRLAPDAVARVMTAIVDGCVEAAGRAAPVDRGVDEVAVGRGLDG